MDEKQITEWVNDLSRDEASRVLVDAVMALIDSEAVALDEEYGHPYWTACGDALCESKDGERL